MNIIACYVDSMLPLGQSFTRFVINFSSYSTELICNTIRLGFTTFLVDPPYIFLMHIILALFDQLINVCFKYNTLVNLSVIKDT